MSISLWNGDLHIHTNLSYCAPRETDVACYLPFCEEENISVLGFSNHLYQRHRLPNPETLPIDAGTTRVLEIRPEIEKVAPTTSVRLLTGCEVEVVYGQEPSLDPIHSHQFDYILIAASHVLNIRQDYEGYDLSTPDKLRDLLLNRFYYACQIDYGAPVGICHPLYPICSPEEQEVVDGITDSQLADCFTLAAKRHISIEIHASLYRGGTQLNEEGVSPSYMRLLKAAKACGCKFHFGTDAHSPNMFRGYHTKLRRAAELCGITPLDMWDLPGLA